MAVELALMVVGIGLSIAAGYMLKKKEPNLNDDKPATLATRGSFAPWIRGIRRVGPIICWVADTKYTTRERIEGAGKGNPYDKPKQTIYHQSGLHVLCAGEAYALHEITVNGKRIAEFDKVTRDSHPSGTLITLEPNWAFRIYWGGADQDGADPDPYLSDAIDSDSVFPYFCYVVWQPMKLGPQVMWPAIEYLLEVRCENSTLANSAAEVLPTYELVSFTPGVDSPGYHQVFWAETGPQGSSGADIHNLGNGAVGYFVVGGWDTDFFFAGSKFVRTGLSGDDEEYTVFAVERYSNPFQRFFSTVNDDYLSLLFIYPEGGIANGYPDTSELGDIVALKQSIDYGVNPAHAFEEMLFLPYPLGIGMSRDRWDIDSLEDLGELMEDEDVAGSLIAQGGATVRDVLGPALIDIGCALPVDTATGNLKFRPVRKPAAIDMDLVDDMLVAPLPERIVQLADEPADKLIFSWPDRSINYRKMTVTVDDDGKAMMGSVPRAREVPITMCIDYATGSRIARRREPEEAGEKNAFSIFATRAARTLVPGDVITCDDFEDDEILRVVGVGVDTNSGKILVKCLPDFFGVDPAEFDPPAPPGSSHRFEDAPDAGFLAVEIPAIASGDDSAVLIAVPRIRSSEEITYGRIHISVDGSTYTDLGTVEALSGGGALEEALATNGAVLLDSLDYTAAGGDDDVMPDYSGDDASWRSGKLLVILRGEIMFAQSLTALGGGSFRLNNVLRARFDTSRQSHSIGDPIIVTPLSTLRSFADALIVPGVDPLYVKAQPVGRSAVPLSLIAADEVTLYGKGPRPMPCANLRCSAPLPSVAVYGAGDDITLSWAYRSFQYRSASAALLPAGAARGAIAFEGSFVLEMLDGSDTLIATHNSATASFEYSNAQLVSDFGSEPSTFKVRLSATANGRTSSSITLTITKV